MCIRDRSKAFARLPEEILYPWLPGLLLSLRPYSEDLLPKLLKDVNGLFPKDCKSLGMWQAPWDKKQSEASPTAAAPGTLPQTGSGSGASITLSTHCLLYTSELGMPILHGAVNKLIHQLRYLLN